MVANRLSADGRFSVLLLEAGKDADKNFRVDLAVAAGDVSTDPQYLWNDLTVPQKYSKYYNNQVFPYFCTL